MVFSDVNLGYCLVLKTSFSTSAVNQDNVTNNGPCDSFVPRNYTEGSLTERAPSNPTLQSVLSCEYVAGFVDAEGVFSVSIVEGKYSKPQVSLSLRVSQKAHSAGILNDLQKFFGAGTVGKPAKRNQVCEFSIKKLSDIISKVIPFFEKNPLVTSKQLNFLSFKKAAQLVISGEYLTDEGLNKLKELKANMNTGRSFEEKFRHCWAKYPIDLKSG